MNIGVTGTIGAGKSSVCKSLSFYLGAELVDVDGLCKDQMQQGMEGYNHFVQKFSSNYLLKNGDIDRAKTRELISQSDDARQTLENILHPIVKQDVIALCRLANTNKSHMIIEVPLLFEANWEIEFDHTVSIFTEHKETVSRLCKRDKINEEYAERLLSLQFSSDKKARLADTVIDNSSTYVETSFQIIRFVEFLRKIGYKEQKQ